MSERAAAERDKLRALVTELRAALRPLAELNDVCLRSFSREHIVWGLNAHDVTAGHIRDACVLLGLPEMPELACVDELRAGEEGGGS